MEGREIAARFHRACKLEGWKLVQNWRTFGGLNGADRLGQGIQRLRAVAEDV